MIDASLMLQQVQAEQVPDTWHVIRPKSQVRIATLLGALPEIWGTVPVAFIDIR